MKWVLGTILTLIIISVLFVLKYGITPRALAIIKPTYFDKKQEIGAVIFRRLFQDMKQINGILVETDPSIRDGEDVWLGLLKVASLYGKKMDFIIQHHELKTLTDRIPSVRMDLIKHKKEVRRLLVSALQSKKNVLIHGPIETPLKDLNLLTITQQTFVVHPKDEESLQCPDQGDKTTHKSCQALHLSRRYYRKKLKSDRISAALEKFKDNTFTLFIYEPIYESSHP